MAEKGLKHKYDAPDFSRLPVTIHSWKLAKRQTIKISHDFVRVTEKGLNASKWEEPVSAFRGILRRTDEETQGVGPQGEGGKVTVHLVELDHPDRRKTIRLYKSESGEDIRKLWKDAARALHLAALDETSCGMVTCAPEDLDKSIRDLAAEGKISAYFDSIPRPPKGIVCKQAEGELKVTLRRVTKYTNVFQFSGGVFAILIVSLGWGFSGGLRFFVGIAGVCFVILGVGTQFLDWIAKRRIVITGRELNYFRESPFGIFSQKTISLNKLENIRRISRVSSSLSFVVTVALSHAEELVIESDTTSISIGNLDEQQRFWLEKFLLSAIITAPNWPDTLAQRKNNGR